MDSEKGHRVFAGGGGGHNVPLAVDVSRGVLAHLEGNFFNPKFPAILPYYFPPF